MQIGAIFACEQMFQICCQFGKLAMNPHIFLNLVAFTTQPRLPNCDGAPLRLAPPNKTLILSAAAHLA
jgi:hypothetical protein